MRNAYLITTALLLALMIISIVWVTIHDFLEKKRKKERKKGSKK